MRVLLDTHVLLWAMQGTPTLSRGARRAIDDAEEVHVSSVALWEVAIKVSVGKLHIDAERLQELVREAGYLPLPVTWEHVDMLRRLPLHHRDPFDRMLVAQAMSEPIHLLTRDAALARYSPLVTVL